MSEMTNKEGEDTFVIHTLTEKSPDLKKYFLDASERASFLPALDDVECYLACDPTSLLVGELNGKPIATAAAFQYDEDHYCHFGCYVVEKEYRGQGYGMQLTAEAGTRCTASTPARQLLVAGYTVPDMLEEYKAMFPVEQHWPVEVHAVDVAKALTLLNDDIGHESGSEVVDIKQVSEVDLKDVCNYDAKVFGYKREKFVEQLLQVSRARVAVNQQNEIVGYTAARVLYKPDSGYKVGPVFGESFEIAKSLLKELFQAIMQCERSSKKTVMISFPAVVNPDANELAKFLCGEILMKCMFVSYNGLPKYDLKKWFGVTALEAG